MAERRQAWVVAAVVLAAYATSFAGGFQFDDWNVIVEDPRVQSPAAWWAAQPTLRPLLGLSYALNTASGLGLPGFHAVNLAIHLGAALLALGLLRRLERWFTEGERPAPSGAPPGPRRLRLATWAAPSAPLLGALLFALHPVQTEAVTYLSGRSSSLAALLALASLATWLEGRERGAGWLTRGLSPLLLAASLGVKETALILPAALLLLALVRSRLDEGAGASADEGAGEIASAGAVGGAGSGRATATWRTTGADLAPHLGVVALAGAAALASPSYRALLAHAAALRPPLETLVAHLGGLAWLVGQLLRPWRLLADPGPPPDPSAATLALAGLVAAGVVALLWFGLAAAAGRATAPARRAAGLAATWLLLWLPPTGWLLARPEPANDRQLYLALLGPAWLVGRLLAPRIAAGGWRGRAAGLATALLLAGLAALTADRSLVYRDERTFWSEVVAQAPANARARNNLGLALSAACRLPEARAAFREALRLEPGHARARVNLWLLEQGSPPGERPGAAPRCPPAEAQPPASAGW